MSLDPIQQDVMDQMQRELIQSNEYLRIQIWILGAGIGIISTVAMAFARSAWIDTQTMLKGHEIRIRKVEGDTGILMDRGGHKTAKA